MRKRTPFVSVDGIPEEVLRPLARVYEVLAVVIRCMGLLRLGDVPSAASRGALRDDGAIPPAHGASASPLMLLRPSPFFPASCG